MSINQQKGLTLIGVIISIFITSTGLVAALALANMSIKGAFVGEKRLIAFGLVQEGVEIVRDVRRSNTEWINWDWYGNGGAITTSTNQDYRAQYDNASFLAFLDVPLKIDGDGFYQYDSGLDTMFYRKVNLTKVSYKEVKVVVEVKWQLKGQWYYLTAEDHLWRWK